MARALKVLGIVVAALGLLVVAAMLLVQSEWGERRLESLAAERIGREVDLEGLRLRAAWPPQVELAALWRQLPALAPQERAAIEAMTRHLAERILRPPLERLGRDRDGRIERAVRDVFAL